MCKLGNCTTPVWHSASFSVKLRTYGFDVNGDERTFKRFLGTMSASDGGMCLTGGLRETKIKQSSMVPAHSFRCFFSVFLLVKNIYRVIFNVYMIEPNIMHIHLNRTAVDPFQNICPDPQEQSLVSPETCITHQLQYAYRAQTAWLTNKCESHKNEKT